MAVGTFTCYNSFLKYIGDGTIDMNSTIFRMRLFLSTSNFATQTLSTAASLTNQVANGSGYTTGGKSLTSLVWSTGASAKQQKWSWANVFWSANGGTITGIKAFVIVTSAGKNVGFCQLSTSAFNVTDTNRITIAPPATGILTLTKSP